MSLDKCVTNFFVGSVLICSVAMGSSLILFGGFSVDHDWMNDVHVLDTGTIASNTC